VLFTRTIRRKMMFFLVLVLVMLATLSLSGVSGLLSYRNAVRDLDYSINEVPQVSDLTTALGRLLEPLHLELPESLEAARFQKEELQKSLAQARGELDAFRRKLKRLPDVPATWTREAVLAPLLDEVERVLNQLGELQPRRATPGMRLATAREMSWLIGHAQKTLLSGMPHQQDGPNQTLSEARRHYRSHLGLVTGATVVVVVLFAGLVRYGYTGVFRPLQHLHRGALRVAQGDLSYRIKVASNDEVAELAESFNKMTARFQEIAADKDRQVRERSKQLVRSERLAGIGFLAAGVAHEINNPLSAIGMAAESLEYRLLAVLETLPAQEAGVVREYLQMMQREAQRCQQITTRLLDFARGQNATRHRQDLTALVAEVLAMIAHMSKFRDRRIEFARSEPCWVEVNGPEIKQVILNLVANALESMDAGKLLKIDIQEQTDQVVLIFRDEGCGMTPEVLENLFDPFFTQRKDGKGTGLGLSISQRIVGDHGGTIEARSDGPDQGSTFVVHLPRAAAARQAA
jgi:signal transduction histidine kinase